RLPDASFCQLVQGFFVLCHEASGNHQNILVGSLLLAFQLAELDQDIARCVVFENDGSAVLIHQPCHTGEVLVGFGDGHQIVCIDDHVRHLLLLPVYTRSRRNTTYKKEMVPIEIKIPKEIRNYHENIFFGLNTRQFVCSLLALGAAVGLYFCLRPIVGAEQVGWMCILGAVPFAACGFFSYHGMTAEQLLWAWIKSEVLTPKRLV